MCFLLFLFGLVCWQEGLHGFFKVVAADPNTERTSKSLCTSQHFTGQKCSPQPGRNGEQENRIPISNTCPRYTPLSEHFIPPTTVTTYLEKEHRKSPQHLPYFYNYFDELTRVDKLYHRERKPSSPKCHFPSHTFQRRTKEEDDKVLDKKPYWIQAQTMINNRNGSQQCLGDGHHHSLRVLQFLIKLM